MTNAGKKLPANTAIIASQAVLRAEAQMTQPALSSCPFGANFKTPLVGDKVGLETLIVKPLVGDKVGLKTLMERCSSDHPRQAEL